MKLFFDYILLIDNHWHFVLFNLLIGYSYFLKHLYFSCVMFIGTFIELRDYKRQLMKVSLNLHRKKKNYISLWKLMLLCLYLI